MKRFPLIIFIFSAVYFCSCSKIYPTLTGYTPVKFTGTVYDSLGTYDKMGVPKYLTTPDSITMGLSNFIHTNLPNFLDLTKSHPELFSSTASANLNFTQNTNVAVTFVSQKGYYRNTLAYYTYPTQNPPTTPSNIAKITYIFPNATPLNAGGGLPLGSKVNIGTFGPGTSIGFVLMAYAWNDTTSSIRKNGELFLSADALNPENDPAKKRHVVLLHYQDKTLICFEDQNRAVDSDNDFNDEILYTTQTPAP